MIKKMGQSSSRVEKICLLEDMVPKAFRLCVDDLSTEHLTEREKKKIERFVYSYLETHFRVKTRVAEHKLLHDYSKYI